MSPPHTAAPVATPQAPWHMWGSFRKVEHTPAEIATGLSQKTVQLVKVSYRRPELWRFLFACRLVKAPSVATPPAQVYVNYNVTVGLGRSMFQLWQQNPGALQGFCKFQFQLGVGVGVHDGKAKWTTVVQSSLLQDQYNDPATVGEWGRDAYPMDLLPAQDIQVQAETTVISADPQTWNTIIEPHAYFCPNVHMRPDWFAGKFLGAEKGGT